MEGKTYKVFLREVHIQEVTVEAADKDDALQKALDGDCEYGNVIEYEKTLEDGHTVIEF
jgi:hypothetical protein